MFTAAVRRLGGRTNSAAARLQDLLHTSHAMRTTRVMSSEKVINDAFEDPTGNSASQSRESETRHGEKQQLALLEAALHHVPDLGWSRESLEAGATDIGIEHMTVGKHLNSDDPIDLVHFFIRKSNKSLAQDVQLNEALQKCNLSMGSSAVGDAEEVKYHQSDLVVERVKLVARARLSMLTPYLDDGHWLQAMALGALPEHAEATGRLALETIDEIWHVAGDRSANSNWYTRRIGLLPGYCATELFMLTDDSMEREDTWDFLDWHIDKVFGNSSSARQEPDKRFQQDSGASKRAAETVRSTLSNSIASETNAADRNTNANESAPRDASELESDLSSGSFLGVVSVAAKGFGGLVSAVASMTQDAMQESMRSRTQSK